jgi:hypothetical protein
MLIEFTLGNYRSFFSEQTLSFRATSLISEDKSLDESNIIDTDNGKIVKTVGIYGANASGKSNLIKGLRFFQNLISSSLDARVSQVSTQPFKLKINKEQSGFFQIVLLIGANRYRYGLTISKEGNISNEWLFGPAEKYDTYYFKRTGNKIQVNHDRFKEGIDIPYEDKLRPDALFLSFCSSYNGDISNLIREYIASQIYIFGSSRRGANFIVTRLQNGTIIRDHSSTNALLDSGDKSIVLNYMNEAGLIYSDVRLQKPAEESRPLRPRVLFSKNVLDEKGEVIASVEMDLQRDESEGTQKYYDFIGEMHFKFRNGGVFVCDEIDSNFHPSLLQKIVRLFNNSNVNQAGAQLLFTSHDTNLMRPDIMRRDQFYFTEKTSAEETRLYSLADLKGIRNNADFARQYLAGFYGALPLLSNLIENSDSNDHENKE